MPIIAVANLIKNYGNLQAVKNVSFEVREGEIFGLLGSNGAGKTTTLEILETLRKKDAGTVVINGLDIDTYPNDIKKHIGVQLQSAGFYPNLNLIQLIQLFSGLYNVNVNPLELLQSVQLEDKAKSRFKQLSGGQQQRFSIATTIINRPKIIFLDEPTTGLDPKARRNLWDLIKQLKREGSTIVITTHYMDEAEELCDRVAIMNKGKIIDLDTPESMINKLINSGFKRNKVIKQADLEDVFISLTGNELNT